MMENSFPSNNKDTRGQSRRDPQNAPHTPTKALNRGEIASSSRTGRDASPPPTSASRNALSDPPSTPTRPRTPSTRPSTPTRPSSVSRNTVAPSPGRPSPLISRKLSSTPVPQRSRGRMNPLQKPSSHLDRSRPGAESATLQTSSLSSLTPNSRLSSQRGDQYSHISAKVQSSPIPSRRPSTSSASGSGSTSQGAQLAQPAQRSLLNDPYRHISAKVQSSPAPSRTRRVAPHLPSSSSAVTGMPPSQSTSGERPYNQLSPAAVRGDKRKTLADSQPVKPFAPSFMTAQRQPQSPRSATAAPTSSSTTLQQAPRSPPSTTSSLSFHSGTPSPRKPTPRRPTSYARPQPQGSSLTSISDPSGSSARVAVPSPRRPSSRLTPLMKEPALRPHQQQFITGHRNRERSSPDVAPEAVKKKPRAHSKTPPHGPRRTVNDGTTHRQLQPLELDQHHHPYQQQDSKPSTSRSILPSSSLIHDGIPSHSRPESASRRSQEGLRSTRRSSSPMSRSSPNLIHSTNEPHKKSEQFHLQDDTFVSIDDPTFQERAVACDDDIFDREPTSPTFSNTSRLSVTNQFLPASRRKTLTGVMYDTEYNPHSSQHQHQYPHDADDDSNDEIDQAYLQDDSDDIDHGGVMHPHHQHKRTPSRDDDMHDGDDNNHQGFAKQYHVEDPEYTNDDDDDDNDELFSSEAIDDDINVDTDGSTFNTHDDDDDRGPFLDMNTLTASAQKKERRYRDPRADELELEFETIVDSDDDQLRTHLHPARSPHEVHFPSPSTRPSASVSSHMPPANTSIDKRTKRASLLELERFIGMEPIEYGDDEEYDITSPNAARTPPRVHATMTAHDGTPDVFDIDEERDRELDFYAVDDDTRVIVAQTQPIVNIMASPPVDVQLKRNINLHDIPQQPVFDQQQHQQRYDGDRSFSSTTTTTSTTTSTGAGAAYPAPATPIAQAEEPTSRADAYHPPTPVETPQRMTPSPSHPFDQVQQRSPFPKYDTFSPGPAAAAIATPSSASSPSNMYRRSPAGISSIQQRSEHQQAIQEHNRQLSILQSEVNELCQHDHTLVYHLRFPTDHIVNIIRHVTSIKAYHPHTPLLTSIIEPIVDHHTGQMVYPETTLNDVLPHPSYRHFYQPPSQIGYNTVSIKQSTSSGVDYTDFKEIEEAFLLCRKKLHERVDADNDRYDFEQFDEDLFVPLSTQNPSTYYDLHRPSGCVSLSRLELEDDSIVAVIYSMAAEQYDPTLRISIEPPVNSSYDTSDDGFDPVTQQPMFASDHVHKFTRVRDHCFGLHYPTALQVDHNCYLFEDGISDDISTYSYITHPAETVHALLMRNNRFCQQPNTDVYSPLVGFNPLTADFHRDISIRSMILLSPHNYLHFYGIASLYNSFSHPTNDAIAPLRFNHYSIIVNRFIETALHYKYDVSCVNMFLSLPPHVQRETRLLAEKQREETDSSLIYMSASSISPDRYIEHIDTLPEITLAQMIFIAGHPILNTDRDKYGLSVHDRRTLDATQKKDQIRAIQRYAHDIAMNYSRPPLFDFINLFDNPRPAEDDDSPPMVTNFVSGYLQEFPRPSAFENHDFTKPFLLLSRGAKVANVLEKYILEFLLPPPLPDDLITEVSSHTQHYRIDRPQLGLFEPRMKHIRHTMDFHEANGIVIDQTHDVIDIAPCINYPPRKNDGRRRVRFSTVSVVAIECGADFSKQPGGGENYSIGLSPILLSSELLSVDEYENWKCRHPPDVWSVVRQRRMDRWFHSYLYAYGFDEQLRYGVYEDVKRIGFDPKIHGISARLAAMADRQPTSRVAYIPKYKDTFVEEYQTTKDLRKFFSRQRSIVPVEGSHVTMLYNPLIDHQYVSDMSPCPRNPIRTVEQLYNDMTALGNGKSEYVTPFLFDRHELIEPSMYQGCEVINVRGQVGFILNSRQVLFEEIDYGAYIRDSRIRDVMYDLILDWRYKLNILNEENRRNHEEMMALQSLRDDVDGDHDLDDHRDYYAREFKPQLDLVFGHFTDGPELQLIRRHRGDVGCSCVPVKSKRDPVIEHETIVNSLSSNQSKSSNLDLTVQAWPEPNINSAQSQQQSQSESEQQQQPQAESQQQQSQQSSAETAANGGGAENNEGSGDDKKQTKPQHEEIFESCTTNECPCARNRINCSEDSCDCLEHCANPYGLTAFNDFKIRFYCDAISREARSTALNHLHWFHLLLTDKYPDSMAAEPTFYGVLPLHADTEKENVKKHLLYDGHLRLDLPLVLEDYNPISIRNSISCDNDQDFKTNHKRVDWGLYTWHQPRGVFAFRNQASLEVMSSANAAAASSFRYNDDADEHTMSDVTQSLNVNRRRSGRKSTFNRQK